MSKFYFTFGPASQFPVKNGYITVEAENMRQAVSIFRLLFPDVNPGVLNCSFVYGAEEWEKATANHKMDYYGEISIKSTIRPPKIKCSICGKSINEKESHNAFPVTDGRCCSECNLSVVIPKRFNSL